jgi:probable F420-dependent oxidoreductase
MHVGVVFSQADSGTDADAIRRWAITADAAGLHHMMAYDHVLGAPLSRLGADACKPFPTPPYTEEHTFHEVFTLFAHLAAVTTSLQFVPSALVLPQRQTALVAKQMATVGRLSGGRLNVAVGIGWNHAEFEAMGADFANRTPMIEEQVTVIRLLLSQPLVTFTGRFHALDQVGINPLPDQPIPVWMASGGSDQVLRRVARSADGWMPLIAPGLDKYTVADSVERLRRICEGIGRDPATMPVWGRCYIDDSDSWKPKAELAAELGFSHFSVGVDRFAFPPLSHEEHLARVLAVVEDVRAIVA